ncbi:recombinase family protein [Metaplanococcus flavidus]|uniref:Recombinase family protein n=1 Tax=Metaplanococcus flavidus TaxID=569883 RepID=A0ABW3LC78_9BACL
MNDKNKVVQRNQPRLVVYTRHTSQNQLAGYQVNRSIQKLKDECQLAGYNVTNVYLEESRQPSYRARPVLKQMLKDAFNGSFEVVMIADAFTLSSDGEERQQLEIELAGYNIVLYSESDYIADSPEEGMRLFEYMRKLINTKHLRLAALQGISLSQVARWMIEDDCKGGETIVKPCEKI